MTPKATLNVLTAMHEAASAQFQAATMIAIGVTMKKLDLKSLTIEPDDIQLLQAGEKLDVRMLPNGGLQYVFIDAEQVVATVAQVAN